MYPFGTVLEVYPKTHSLNCSDLTHSFILNALKSIKFEECLNPSRNRFSKLLNKQQMKGTSTFTDGASNQTNLISLSQSNAKGGVIHFVKDLFNKVMTLFVQEDISETIVNTTLNDDSVKIKPVEIISNEANEAIIPSLAGTKNNQFSHINYQLNIQQMNLFTYLRRAITSSEESLSGQFLEQFRDFLSVIVGVATDNNAPLGSVKRDFGILSYLGGEQLLSSKLFNSPAMRSWTSVMFLTLFTAFGALAQVTGATTPAPDLSVKKTINNQSPTLGTDVTYTINVQNSGAAATGVELTDLLPTGVTLKTVTVSAGSETHTSGTSIIWNVGNVAAGTVTTPTELTMTVVATVTARGLSFNVAEITKENEQDLDSTPNNKDFNEDDIDAVCFSIEDYWYKGDEFTINVPAGYTGIKWFKKVINTTEIAITSTTPGVTLNTDGSLIVKDITAYTEFRFEATNKNCPVGGCCPAKFIPGPLGSIGDYVFKDTNGDGIQDSGEPGIGGVTVNLYKGSTLLATNTTDANGKYNFPNLGSGTDYQVEFIALTQSKFTGSLLGGDETKDSNAQPNGKSGLITIDVTKLPTDVLRNNPTIDAGIIPLGSIGDYVFNDNNGNSVQDAGDTPVGAGIKVTLTDKDGNILTSTVTDANGKYEFIVPSGQYIIIFDKPAGTTFSDKGVVTSGGTPATDSDADITTGKTGIITIDATKPVGDPARNNKDIDAGIKPICNINAGTLATTTPNICLPVTGGVVLTATVATSPIVPAGCSLKYILTQGVNLVIQQVANTPTFTVTTAGEYRIHTLVFDGNSANANYLYLGVVVLGTTKVSDVLGIINTNRLCAALDVTGVKFNVNPVPEAPMFTAKTICASEKVTIGSTGPIVVGISYAWFDSPTATVPFATTQSIEVSPAITTTYYVETTVVVPFACPSKRGSVTVTVNPKPENPVAKSTLTNDCTKNLQTVNLADAITTIPPGSTIEWHVSNNPISAIITNTTTAGAGTYYAFAKSTAGCYSRSVIVIVTITTCSCQNPATVSVAPLAAICGNTTTAVQLTATIGGGATGGTWTSTGTGIFNNATSLTAKYTPSAADVSNGSVELTFTTNDPDGADTKCSAAVAKTTLSLKAKPAAPYNLRCDTLICLGEGNKLFAVSQGNTVKWYESATSTTSIGTGSDNGFIVTPNAEGIFIYYAEATTSDGCISERSAISFRVKRCLTDLVVIKKVVDAPDAQSAPSYLLGQTITYSIEAQNIGTVKATDVKVDDILPTGATYVSSTPSGAYNNGTSVWTIGDLTAGSTKVLLIQVIFNKIGNIVNTAKISGTNEDPTKLGNNTSTVTTPVIDIADLSLTKVVDKSVVNVGDIVEYTITVLNSGPNTATNVEVKDKLPVGLTFVSSSTLTNSSGTLTGTIASIAKGASTSFKFKATVAAVGLIKNLAEVSKSDQKDPDSTPGNASTTPTEDDDDSVDINTTQKCDVTPPVADCKRKEICVGESTLITATGCSDGTTIWSNGQTGTSITVSPKANATYTAYCKKSDDCKSDPSNEVKVTVITISAPLLSSSPSKICAGESVTLTAKGCDGVIEWQTSPVQTTPSITVSPLVSNTYTAVCKQFGCVSPAGSVDVIVTPKPKAPELLCEKEELCPGEDMTLTAINCNGQVKWSTGQETTTIIVKPTVTTSYTATCTINGCTSDPSKAFTITVKPLVVPTISATNTVICAGSSTNLTATGCTGKVIWYYDDKTLTGATITVKPNTTTTYTATCSSVYCISDKSTPVTVKVENPAPPVVSAGTSTICAGLSVELTATGCDGTVTWLPGGLIGNKITVTPTVSTSYTATCTIGTCVSPVSNKKDITVTDFAKPTITADRLTICAGMSIVLTSNGCNGTVTWSDGVTGSPRTITPTADIKYTAICESATCKSVKSNELSIKVNTPPAPPAITCIKTEICAGESVTFTAANCTGTVKWSDGQTGTSIIVKPSTTTTYSAVCATGSNCESVKSNEKTITVNPAVVLNLTASASPANICSGSETTLTLAGCTGTITWTGGLTGASIKVKPTTTTTYNATCSGVACATSASANVKVTVLPGATTPTIAASGTQICVGGEVTLTANNCNGTVLWSNSATTVAITVKPTVTTTYTVQCKVEGCGDAKTSEPVIVKVGNPEAPIVSSTPSTVCAGGSVVLTAVGCISGTVVWSNGKTGNSITETVNSTTTYSAVCKVGTCNSPESNKVTVIVTIPSVPTISCATSTICAGSEITLVATGCEGTVKWSDGQTGASVKSSPTKTTDYTATCTIGTCTSNPSSVATVNVGNPPAPTIVCNATSICQGIQITLTGGNCSGTIVWNDGQVGNVITAKPNATTKYTAICKLDKCESGKSNEVTISVGAGGVTPKTKNLNNVCPFLTVDLASGVTSSSTGTYEYHTGVLSSSPLVSNPNAVGTGTYYVFEKTGSGCYSAPGVINVFINADCTPVDCAKTPATASAGADATICSEKIYKLSGTFGGAAKFVTWTTSGTGTFDNPMSPTATYRSSLADVIAGTVKLTITTNDPDGTGSCTAATASMTLKMEGVKFKPTVSAAGNLTTCAAEKVTLTATTGTYGYKWFKVGTTTEIASTKSITVDASGAYYFKLVDANKCCSIESDTVTVNYLTAPATPIANSVKIDRGTTVDLTKLVVSNTPAGATLIFKIGVSSSSTMVASPTAVGAGVYYACYKSAQGCFSEATKITVENKDTGTKTTDADVQITVTTENNIALDSTVKITITVKNNGPATAKGVIVSAPIPSGLTYISSTGGLVKTGSLLGGTVDSLISGGVKIYTWVGKMSVGTTSVTVGATGGSTNPDPNPGNNNGSNPNGNVVVTVPPANSADIIVTITTDKTTYAVGDTVTTTIKVTNLGPATAKGISVYSAIPGTLTYIGQTGGLVKTGNMLTALIASLDKDGMVVYIYKAKLTSTGETVIAVGGTSTTTDPNPSNNNGTGSGTTTINKGIVDPTLADVSVVITADKSIAKVGDNVNFLITLTNNGPATAKQVVLSNVIPTGLTFVSSSTGQTLTSGAVTVSLDSLQKGQTRTYAYVAKMNVKSNVTNAVSVNSLKDAVAPNNFSFVVIKGTSDSIVIPPTKKGAELALNLSSDFQLIAKDDEVTFTIKVTNNGPEVATNVVVDNILPKYLSYISGQTTKAGDTLRAAVASIPVGSMVTYSYKAKVVKDTIISNTARITKSTPVDSILTNNVSTVILVPASDTSKADLGVLITANRATYKKDENVTYTITLINNGGGKGKNVELCNAIPRGLTYVSSTNGIVKTGDSLKIKVDTISKGLVRIYTFIVKASQTGSFTNTVSICKTGKSDLILPNNTSSVTIKVTADSIPPVVDSCRLGLAMSVIDTAKVSNGVYNVTYRLIAKNFCKDTLRNVTLTSNLASTFKTPVACELVGKPNSGLSTNLVVNDLFSKADSNLVKTGSYMLPGAVDTIKYVVKVTVNGNKGPFYSQAVVRGKRPNNTVLTAKSSDGANVNGTPSRTILRFDLPNTRIGLAKEVVTTALKNDSTTYWTVPYRIRVVNMGANLIKSLSVKDSLDAVFTAKGVTIVGVPTLIATPGLTINKKYTGKGLNTELLVPDSSSIAKGDTAIIDLTVRVNTILSSDPDNIFNNVAIGSAKGSDNATYKDISTNGTNPDKNGDKDPSNDNEATPVQLKAIVQGVPSLGIALAAVSDTIPLADSTCNITLIMTVRNYANVDLKKIRLCNNLENTIGTSVESWKLIGLPRVIKGRVKINLLFNGKTDSTLVKADSSFLAIADTIQIAYMINIKRPISDTIYTQAVAKAISSTDSTKIFSDLSVNGINPDVNGNGKAEEASLTPIICRGAATQLSSIFIPQGFSPNGDGKNDNFAIQGVKPIEQVELIIFNRYGGVVYANQDYKNDWTGAANQGVKVIGDGQGLPDGTYFYSVTRSLRADGTKVDLTPIVKYITIMR